MARWMREPEPHELDDLSTQQYREIADGHDLDAWDVQQEGFSQLRDLAADLAVVCRDGVDRLREGWEGSGADSYLRAVGKVVAVLEELRDSAASNSTGMQEISVAARQARESAVELDAEDKDWKANPDQDDEQTLKLLRDKVREEAQDKAKATSETCSHLAGAYLQPPPEPLRVAADTGLSASAATTTADAAAGAAPLNSEAHEPGESTVAPVDAAASANAADLADAADPASTANTANATDPATEPAPDAAQTRPTLQSAASPTSTPGMAAVDPTPTPAAPPPDTPNPAPGGVGPMGPGGAVPPSGTAGGESGAANRQAQGAQFDATRQRPTSRMRSDASRQELLNRQEHGQWQRGDPDAERRAVDADPESPLAPADNTVVPSVITGGVPVEGPHDSGPVLTGVVYRHYPEYGEPEPASAQTFEEEYEDGSTAEVEYAGAGDTEHDLNREAAEPPQPPDTAQQDTTEAESERRLFTTLLKGKDFLEALRGLPSDKTKPFIAAQRALREAESADGESSAGGKPQ